MATHEQKESAIEQIELLQSELRVAWPTMTRGEKVVELEEIEWAGFTRDQELMVIGRILAEEPPELWMRDIPSDISIVGEVRAEEHAVRLGETESMVGNFDGEPFDREQKYRELFDTSNRVLFAKYLEEHSLDLGVALRPVEQVREIFLKEAEKTWDGFREECKFRTNAEITETLDLFKAKEAEVHSSKTLMDHLNAGGLFLRPVFDPNSVSVESTERDSGGAGIRPLTQELIECCQLDVWPGMATVVDFGIDSSSHLGAIQYALREHLVTPQELDAAMGKGDALTEIAQRGDNPYRNVTFKTSWEGLPVESEEPHAVAVSSSKPQSASSFDRQLDEAAEQGKYLESSKNKGIDR